MSPFGFLENLIDRMWDMWLGFMIPRLQGHSIEFVALLNRNCDEYWKFCNDSTCGLGKTHR